jgi:hypothetical protein
MMPGDTQEVVYAIFMAQGADNINSITKLKEKAQEIHDFWRNDFPTEVNDHTSVVPLSYSLAQNYPNPFNPSTTIEYTLPGMNNPPAGRQGVQLIIYNVLGQMVATLVNNTQPPGRYKVEFDGTNYASGVYFYRLTAGSFVKTNKMILIR